MRGLIDISLQLFSLDVCRRCCAPYLSSHISRQEINVGGLSKLRPIAINTSSEMVPEAGV